MPTLRMALIWLALAGALLVPLIAAASSPLLAWRHPIYIGAGFAGILGLGLLLLQPLVISGALPGITRARARHVHKWIGAGLVLAVVVHVIGLWITSPPDVIDALLFVSPTPFAAWGVIAMWALLFAGALAVLRRTLRLKPSAWRTGHILLVWITVIGTIVHAVLIEGTMEPLTKVMLCGLVGLALVGATWRIWPWPRAPRHTKRSQS